LQWYWIRKWNCVD